MPDTLLVSHRDGVCTLTLNRPAVRNAVDAATMIRLREEIEARAEDGTRVIVITGADGAFSSGADLRAALEANATADDAYRILTDAYAPALRAVRNSPWPVLAAIDGPAAGIGLDLALACDLRLASARATLAELFIRVGLIPDGGGTYTLQRLVGTGRAMEMILTGEPVTAEAALAMGLVNRVWPAEGFMDAVQAFAATIARQAPLALRRARRAVLDAQTGTFEEALAREAAHQRALLASEDGFEGFRAFLEKRPPRWKGR
ncbi:MAG: 2-(1,2-epoxy-1,2-dihydrophenyl)acetyl-CoA isomerase [Rhodothermaceae bacterium]|nr:MAG: 2-(1,2-epoxy-1,2-dihydrophenyl)acetyl-CoA isomerase [Rhodothermaceae bacterium]